MTAAKLKEHLLPKLPYLALLWFFSKCGEAYRLSAESDTLRKIMDAIANLNPVLSQPLPFVGLIGVAAVCAIVVYKKANRKNWRKDTEYGSARWGNKKDIAPYVDPKPDNNIILTATESLMMNSRPSSPKYARNKNVLVIGGSGSGKTRFFVKPNLMQCVSQDFPVSFCVTDPKGTILVECGNLLKRNGYEIKVLNTIDFKKSLHYNPLSYIRSEKDILKLVTALIANTTPADQKGGDPFWTKSETLLYCALIGYIHYEAAAEEKNINSLVEMINSMEVREDDETYKNAVDYLFDGLENGIPEVDEDGNPILDENGNTVWETPPQPQHFAVRQYKKFLLAAGKTSKSILISCGARLATFDIKEVRDLMEYDEMELDTIGNRKTALFIIISDTDDSFSFIAALMYSQLFNLLCDHADNNCKNGRLPVHVRLLLDEFANIGQIPKFDKLIATIRSREISACIILQAQSQLKSIYKDSAETIIGNCDTVLFLGGKEKTTLKDLSESLGKETVYMLTNNVSRGNSPSYSQNTQKLGKELLSVDELAVLDGGKCIMQLRGVRPFLSEKFDITKHKNYRYLSDANPKYAFNIEKYIAKKKRELIVKPDDDYDYFEFPELDEEIPAEALGDFTEADDDAEYPEDLEPV